MAKGKYEYWLSEDGLLLLSGWARDGLSEEQIARNCGCASSTLREWKKNHPAISAALKKGKEVVDREVENALFNKCVGKYVDEEVAFKCKEVFWDAAGRRCEREEVKTATVKKFIPPETMAQAIWLNNRKPGAWRKNANKERLDDERFKHDKDIDSKKFW